MKLYIRHRTSYRYATPVGYSIQLLRLIPRDDDVQVTQAWQVDVPGRRCQQTDAFGNKTQLITVEGLHDELTVDAHGVVETSATAQGRIRDDGLLSPLAYLAPTPLTDTDPSLASMAEGLFNSQLPMPLALQGLMDRVTRAVQYRAGVTAVSDSARQVIARGEGVCQDQAHVAIAVCRAAGVPARYVSGYLLDEAAPQAASHAWIDVWNAKDAVWHSCDVTHRRPAGEHLCRLAIGRDYLDAAPLRGVRRGGGDEALSVSVHVTASQQQ